MIPLDVTWRHSLSVFWLLVWRGILGAMLIGIACGLCTGFAGARLGLPRGQVVLGTICLNALLGVVWQFVVVGMALRKRYRGFRIVLVAAR